MGRAEVKKKKAQTSNQYKQEKTRKDNGHEDDTETKKHKRIA